MSRTRVPALLCITSLLFLAAGVGNADPAIAPQIQFKQYDSQDVQPLLQEASGAGSVAAFDTMVEARVSQLKSSWELDSYARIQNALMQVHHSDSFNDVDAYRQHIEALLVAQKEEAWNQYWGAMRTELAAGQEAFVKKLSDGSLRMTAESKTDEAAAALSITNNPANPWDSVRTQLDRAHANWERDYLDKLQTGVMNYERAVYSLEAEYASFHQELSKTDQDFQQRLARIEASEARVRSGISVQVDGLESYLQQSDFFYEETCDDQYHCTVDRNRMSAAGLDLTALIGRMRTQIADRAPLSALSREMRDYLAARRAEAEQKEQHWVSLSTGLADYSSGIGIAPRNQDQWALAEGRPYANPNGGDGMAGAYADAVGNFLLYFSDMFGAYGYGEAGYQRRTSAASVIADYLDNPGSEAARIALMDFVLQRGETRTVTGIQGAEITGAVSGSRYSTQGVEAFVKRQPPDASVCILAAAGNIWLGVACAFSTVPVPETSVNVSVSYAWRDENATSNASVWGNYKAEMETATASWDNMLIPAIENWESQVAAYRATYEQWKTDVAAAAPRVQQRYVDARNALVQNEARYLNEMDQLWRQGEAEWAAMYKRVKEQEKAAGWQFGELGYGSQHAGRTAAEKAREEQNAKDLLAQLLGSKPPIREAENTAVTDYAAASSSLRGGAAVVSGDDASWRSGFTYLLGASAGSPDLRLMEYAEAAFSQSLTGSFNFARQSKDDHDALISRDRAIDQLRQAAEQNFVDLDYSTEGRSRKSGADPTENGFTTEVLADGRVRATRKIATGRAALRAGADATKEDAYEAEMADQVLYLAPPEVRRLADSGSLFENWDEQAYMASLQKSEEDFARTTDELFAKAGNELYNANHIALSRLNDFRMERSTLASNASQIKGLMTTLLTGGTVGSYVVDTYKGQVAQALESVTGIPAGMWSAFSGGGSFKECMTSYLEGVAWQNFEKATGLEGSTAFFKQYMAKAKANEARHKAGRVHMEDLALGYAGALTYTWRNAEHRPALKKAVETTEAVVFTTLQVVGSIIPAVGNAAAAGITAGYYAAKNAYLGSLQGGTKGALAGGVSGAVTGVTQNYGVSVGAEYSFENGYSGSIGFGKEVGGVNLGVSAQMQDGKGVTGYGLNIGKSNTGHTAGVGLGFNFQEGKYTGANLTANAGNPRGAGIYGGVNFDRRGYSGVTAGVENRASDERASTRSSLGVTLNRDGSTDTQLSVSGSMSQGDLGQSGLSAFGAGATTSIHTGKDGKTSVSQKTQIDMGYRLEKDAQQFREALRNQQGGRTPSERARDDQNQRDADQRAKKEGQDLAAGVANLATRGKDELDAAAGGTGDLGKWWDKFTGDIEGAIGDFGESVVNTWKHGSFDTTKGLVEQARRKAIEGIKPDMSDKEAEDRYAVNLGRLTPAEREWLNDGERGGGAGIEQLGGTGHGSGEGEAERPAMGLDQAALAAQAIVGITNAKYFEQTGKNLLIADPAAAERLLQDIVDELRELNSDGNYTDAEVMYVAQMHGANLADAMDGSAIARTVAFLQADSFAREQERAEAQRRASERLQDMVSRTGQVQVGEAIKVAVSPGLYAADPAVRVLDERIRPTDVIRGIWKRAFSFDLLGTRASEGWSAKRLAITAALGPFAYSAAAVEGAANTLAYLYEDTKGNYTINPVGTLLDGAVRPIKQGLRYLEDVTLAPDGTEHPASFGGKKFAQGLVAVGSGVVGIVDNPMAFVGQLMWLAKLQTTEQARIALGKFVVQIGNDWSNRQDRAAQQRLAGIAGTGLSLAAAFLLPGAAARLRTLSNGFTALGETAVSSGALESGVGRATPVFAEAAGSQAAVVGEEAGLIKSFETPFKPLSNAERKIFNQKLIDRTLTQDEYARLDWSNRFASRRTEAVTEFWDLERKTLASGQPGTRNWSPAQVAEILAGKRPTFNGQTIQAHHTYSALKYPQLANDPAYIYPATRAEHIYRWHGRSWRNPTHGSPLSPGYLEEF